MSFVEVKGPMLGQMQEIEGLIAAQIDGSLVSIALGIIAPLAGNVKDWLGPV
jgi:hypothetical protein